ncbi:MAG: DNA polymerase III subunit delta [Clostridia bacterium]|nr:DNA polymerase III subunit delta [Clostridia bacterium]
MPEVNEQELKKQIKAGEFANLYLLYGDEKYLVKHYTDLIVKKTVPDDFKAFNLHIYDGKDSDIDDIANATEGLPMMGEYVCILIKDLPIDNLNAETSKKISQIISDISPTTIIIVSLLNIDLKTKNDSSKKMLAQFAANGCTVNFSHPTISQITKLIDKKAKQNGCEFLQNEVNYLVSLVGDDMTTLQNELDKILSYKKEGRVTKEDIDAVAVRNVQAKAFDLAKALTAGNCDRAMSLLDSLFAMREEPINILGAIITPYIDMYRAKVYLAGSMRAEDAAKDFNYRNKEFRLTNAARLSSKYSVTQLRLFLDVLSDADRLLKSSTVDGRLILEQTITKLLLVSNNEKV